MGNKNAFIMLYDAYVRSKLEFASVVWDSPHQNKIDQLEMVQKKFLKFLSWKICGVDDRYTTYSVVLARHGACSLSARRTMSNYLYVFKLLHGFENNASFFERVRFLAPSRSTRQATMFYLPFPRIELFKSSPLYRLLSVVDAAEELDIFCTSLNKIKAYFNGQ